MTNPQLYPLQINAITNEPFLRLRKHENIILTPPRWEDAERLFSSGNDTRVNEWLTVPVPYPMGTFSVLSRTPLISFGLVEAAHKFLSRIVPAATKFFENMEAFKDDATPRIVGDFPVRAIREVQEDGTDVYIGDIGISRCSYGELMDLNGVPVDWENASERKEFNDSLELGDPRILWAIGGTYQETSFFFVVDSNL